MRLIDADALLYELANQSFPQSGEYGRARYRMLADLRNAPTVDAVPVIRCKDCVYCRDTTDGTRKYCTSTGSLVNDGDFCSWAERKEE